VFKDLNIVVCYILKCNCFLQYEQVAEDKMEGVSDSTKEAMRVKDFSFDFSFWTVDKNDTERYHDQETVNIAFKPVLILANSNTRFLKGIIQVSKNVSLKNLKESLKKDTSLELGPFSSAFNKGNVHPVFFSYILYN